MCGHPEEPWTGQARKPRSGRSEAKWLDRAVDRRTLSRRDGRRARDRGTRERTFRAVEARLVDEKQEGGDRRPPQFRIQSGCALTYMNASSGQNLSGTVKRR